MGNVTPCILAMRPLFHPGSIRIKVFRPSCRIDRLKAFASSTIFSSLHCSALVSRPSPPRHKRHVMAHYATSALLLLTSAVCMPAYAASDPWGDSPLTLQVGAFRADADTAVRLDSNTLGRGTQVSFESDLGIQNSKTLPEFSFLWRINPRHGIEGSYLTLNRSGTRAIAHQIQFGDVTYPPGAEVHSKFDSDVFRVAYRYSPINDRGNELGLLLGLHYTTLDAALSTAVGSLSESASFNFPLPTIGVRGGLRLSDSWRLMGFAQLLKLKVGDYDGSLVNLSAGLEWMFLRQAYAGLGYTYYRYDLESEKNDARGEFKYRFSGPTLYFGFAFR